MKKITLLAVCFLCFTGSVNAQLFKKLGKKIEKAAEKTVERKVEQKTRKETEKAFDSTFNKKSERKRTRGLAGLSAIEPAESYAFNYRVEMQITSKKEVMNVDYFLPDTGNYLCALIKDKKIKEPFLTVFDIEREAMFNYMENDGQKMKMGVEFKTDGATDDAINEGSISITATGNSKLILGYNCEEYKMIGEEMTATIWVTKEVDIRFPSTFYKMKQNKNTNQTWMKDLDGWAMEMVMIDTSRRKPQTITMYCMSINESNLIINSNEYQNIGY